MSLSGGIGTEEQINNFINHNFLIIERKIDDALGVWLIEDSSLGAVENIPDLSQKPGI